MIELVQYDTKPDLLLRLRSGGGPVNLSSVASIDFQLLKPSGAILHKSAVVFGNPLEGRCAVTWGELDLDEIGEHVGEVYIDFGGGATQTSKYAIPVYVRERFQERIG